MSYLWRSLEFPTPPARRVPPSTQVLKKLLGWSGSDLRQLTIKNAAASKLGSPKLDTLLRGARHLEHFEIRHAGKTLKECTHPWPRTLRQLTLISTDCPVSLWEAVADGLTYLHLGSELALADRFGRGSLTDLPFLPNLRYIRLTGDAKMTPLVSCSTCSALGS